MLTLDELRGFGANVDEGLARCMNNETFYLGLVATVLTDTKLSELGAALNAGDLDKAFDLAHALKGMYGNLSLYPLFKPINEMTELLRSRTQTDYSALYNDASSQMEKLKALAG